MTPRLAALAIVILGLLTGGCAVNPLTGHEELMFYPAQDDMKLGATLAPKFERALGGRIDIPELQAYIDRIGQHLAGASDHPEWEYHFFAVQDDTVNAMALPGGYIFITRGLLEKLSDEAELAAILGHEVTHVVARDTMNALSKQQSMAALVTAAIVADSSADVAYAGQLTAQVLSLSYSRQDETEADLGGLTYMVRCGYSPQGIIQVMEELQKIQKVRPIEFFSTHPLPGNRLQTLRRRIKRHYSHLTGMRIGKKDYQVHVLDVLKAHPRPKGRRQPMRRDTVSEQRKTPSLSQSARIISGRLSIPPLLRKVPPLQLYWIGNNLC